MLRIASFSFTSSKSSSEKRLTHRLRQEFLSVLKSMDEWALTLYRPPFGISLFKYGRQPKILQKRGIFLKLHHSFLEKVITKSKKTNKKTKSAAFEQVLHSVEHNKLQVSMHFGNINKKGFLFTLLKVSRKDWVFFFEIENKLL